MTRLFDGVAELLTDCLGSEVQHYPAIGEPSGIVSVFRTDPVEVLDAEGGPVLISAATWRVPETRAAGISTGDQIDGWDGLRYRIMSALPTGSPGADRFIIYVLERVV